MALDSCEAKLLGTGNVGNLMVKNLPQCAKKATLSKKSCL